MSTPKVLIATPCYGGQIMRGYLHSMLKLQSEAAKQDIQFVCSTLGNESLITRGRNYFVAQFLADKSFTHLFFIDADITFDTASFCRMVKSNHPISCGAYPKKYINYKKIIDLVKDGQEELLEQISHDYAINIVDDKNPIVNRFLKISYPATGYLCIKREVIERLVEAHPEWKYNNDIGNFADDNPMKECFYAVFDCFICPDTRRYLSEDFAFMKRCAELNYECWLDLTAILEHTGTHTFSGCFYNQIKKHIEPINNINMKYLNIHVQNKTKEFNVTRS